MGKHGSLLNEGPKGLGLNQKERDMESAEFSEDRFVKKIHKGG